MLRESGQRSSPLTTFTYVLLAAVVIAEAAWVSSSIPILRKVVRQEKSAPANPAP